MTIPHARRHAALTEAAAYSFVARFAEAAWLKSTAQRFLAVNRATEAYMGAPRSALVGAPLSRFLAQRTAERFDRHDRLVARCGEPVMQFDHTPAQGWCASVKAPVFGSDRQVVAILGYGRALRTRRDVVAALDSLASTTLPRGAASGETAGFSGSAPLPRWASFLQEAREEAWLYQSVDAIASSIGICADHLCRSFKARLGLTPSQYRQILKVRVAARLLLRRDGAIADIAAAAGFSDQSHMTRELRRRTGLTPVQFMEAFGDLPD